ncbi:hypothetical protein [Corynebacterium sp. AOP40-4SA-5]|uniref:hypothetical protein n=1 Tax=Corynebacterium sp. AOP40-4SA-5 TaxID=3457678 RepID=UPI0040335E29
MTVLYGDLRDVQGAPFDQQGTAVVISATQARPAMNSSALTLVELARIEMEDSGGHFETEELDPGPVIVRLEGGVSHGQQWEIGIPDDDQRWNLADLIGEQVEWEPIVVSRAEAAARESRAQADRSEGEADRSERAADRVGSAERVLEAEATAVQSEADALAHQEEATRQATRSEQEADRSAGEASDSASSAGASATSEANAAMSEGNAKTSETNSAGHESRAKGHADTAGEHSTAADGHRQATATSEENAKTSEDNAAGHETRAGQHADTAGQTVRDAVSEATGITEGHKVAAEAAAGNARSAATEGRGYRDAAREAAAQAEDIATGDLPAASESTRGLIQMTGDLAGSGDDPRVPALSLAAPGASVQVVPPGPGWGNAVADPATTPTGWDFDGEWLTPPLWLDRVTVTVDWCGGSSLALRGRRSDGTASTIVTLPEGAPETHRSATVVVDLSRHEAVAVAATWTQEDLDAVCTASLVVQVMPSHQHAREDLPWWDEVMSGYVRGNDERLSDPRYPTEHEHEINQVRGLRAVVDRLTALEALVRARPALWPWDGVVPWAPPEAALPVDNVWDTDGGDVHSVEEVTGDE